MRARLAIQSPIMTKSQTKQKEKWQKMITNVKQSADGLHILTACCLRKQCGYDTIMPKFTYNLTIKPLRKLHFETYV